MKTAFRYALRELWRRPKRMISLVLIISAILVSLFLLLLYMEAEWRADVMPDREDNYHFSLACLTAAQKDELRRQDWVQTTYDTYDYNGQNIFCVRVTWDNVLNAGELARATMEKYDLFHSAAYQRSYETNYDIAYEKFMAYWYGNKNGNGISAETFSRSQAKREVARTVMNSDFYRKTSNSYVFQPEFFMWILLFGIFSASAVTILFIEDYKNSQRELGSLLAVGMRQVHLTAVYVFEVILMFLGAIPVSMLLTTAAVKLYHLVTMPMKAYTDNALFTVADSIPVGLMLGFAGILLVAACIGAGLICFVNRKTPIMAYLREEKRFTVSFVSKTSAAFENAAGADGYNRLYTIRARSTLLRNAAVTACILPLPFYMFSSLAKSFFALGTPDGVMMCLYTVFESAAVLITAVCITMTASRSAAASRAKELGIFRALGADRDVIRKITYPLAGLQGISVVIAAVVMILYTAAVGRTAIDYNTKAQAGDTLKGILTIVSDILGTALFALPSAYGGLAMFLHEFFGKSVIASIREKE